MLLVFSHGERPDSIAYDEHWICYLITRPLRGYLQDHWYACLENVNITIMPLGFKILFAAEMLQACPGCVNNKAVYWTPLHVIYERVLASSFIRYLRDLMFRVDHCGLSYKWLWMVCSAGVIRKGSKPIDPICLVVILGKLLSHEPFYSTGIIRNMHAMSLVVPRMIYSHHFSW